MQTHPRQSADPPILDSASVLPVRPARTSSANHRKHGSRSEQCRVPDRGIFLKFVDATNAVGVLYAKKPLPAKLAREEMIEESSPQPAKMQRAGRGRGESEADVGRDGNRGSRGARGG